MAYTIRARRRFLVIALSSWGARTALSADWTNFSGGDWDVSTNWDIGIPTTGDPANIVDSALSNIIVTDDYDYESDTALASVDIDSTSGRPSYSEVDMTMVRLNLYTGTLTVGNNFRGIFVQEAMGMDSVSSDLAIGNASTGVGTYNMTIGTLDVGGAFYVGDGGNGTMLQSFSTVNETGSGLFVGYSSGAVGNYTLESSAALTVSTSEFIGDSGTGLFQQSSGTHAINGTGASGLYLGFNAGGKGYFNLSGGTLTIASNEDIGCTGTGVFTQTGGADTTLSFYLGINGPADGLTTGNGTYNMTAGTLMSNGGSEFSYEMIGYYGNGTFTQHGGSNTLGTAALPENLYIGYFDGSRGLYTMDAVSGTPTLTVTANEYLGTANIAGYGGTTGTFNQSAGTHTVAGALVIGNGSGSTGVFYLSGSGSLSVQGPEWDGNYGLGEFYQSGGSNQAGSLSIDLNSLGLGDFYNMSGGTLGTATLTNHGSFGQSAGNVSAGSIVNTGTFVSSGSAILAVTTSFTNTGTVQLSGVQIWTAGSSFNNSGGTTIFASDAGSATNETLNVLVSQGTVTFAVTQHLASLSIASGAAAILTGGGNGDRTIVFTPSLSDSGKLDLTGNDLDVQNGGTAGLAIVSSLIQSGYNNGTWTGAGITSSVAAHDTTHLTAVGVILNTINGSTPIYTTFDGATVAVNDVLVKQTYYGDANLDGVVDASDYSRIDNGFLTDATGWFNGDFNYDGIINGSDYTLIDNAFNMQGARMDSVVAAASQTAEIAATAVPEPATIGLATIAAAGMLRRRRLF